MRSLTNPWSGGIESERNWIETFLILELGPLFLSFFFFFRNGKLNRVMMWPNLTKPLKASVFREQSQSVYIDLQRLLSGELHQS